MTRKVTGMVISVIAYQERRGWTAQCLEYDIAAQAKTFSDLRYEVDRVINSHIVVSEELGQEPFAGIGPAPRKFWEMYEDAKLRVEREELPFRLPEPSRGIVITPRLKIAEQHATA